MKNVTFEKLIERLQKRTINTLTLDQLRDIKGRLRMAAVNLESIEENEISLVTDVTLAVVKKTGYTRKFASMQASSGTCPRCNTAEMSPVKLAEGLNSMYCSKCRVCLPS